jgi:hypothetical protein
MTGKSYCREATLKDLINDAQQAQKSLFWGGILGLIAGLLVWAVAMPQYRSQMIIGPMAAIISEDHENVPSIANSQNFEYYDAVLRGSAMATQIFNDEVLRNKLGQSKRWRFLPQKNFRSPQDVQDFLKRRLRYESVGTGNLKKIIFNHPDPAFAQEFVEAVHNKADNYIRSDALSKYQSRIEDMRDALAIEENYRLQDKLNVTIMAYENAASQLYAKQPYAAQIIDPASLSTKSLWPRLSIFLPVFMIMGLFVAFTLHQFSLSKNKHFKKA